MFSPNWISEPRNIDEVGMDNGKQLFFFLIFSLLCSLQLTYSIASGDPDDHLNIKTVKTDGKYLGVVTVEDLLDRETKDLYKLVVSGISLC